jgi:hypothetical protein
MEFDLILDIGCWIFDKEYVIRKIYLPIAKFSPFAHNDNSSSIQYPVSSIQLPAPSSTKFIKS